MGVVQVKKTKFGICDVSRGVFLNRGVFVKAPPGFFQSYPSEFEPIPQGSEKLNVQMRTIETWDPQNGFRVPTPKAAIEIPQPAPTVISETVLSSEQKVAVEVAAEAPAQEATPAVAEAPKTPAPTAMATKKRPANSRKMSIR